MAHQFVITRDEARAIRTLGRLAARWPKGLWLFSADGKLYVMKTNEKGERVYDAGGGVHRDYIETSVNIPSDGGDW